MRNGCPRDKSETTVEEQLQTPDVFIPDDFEDEDIESAAEQLRPMWQKDRLLCENERLRSLKWHYSFGKKIAKHYDAVKKDRESYGKTVYGERYFKRVADAVNARAKKRVSWQLLQGCYALVGTYTEEAFAELCEHEEITPSHAISLAYIKLDDVRPQLQAELIEEKWTVRQLQTALKEKLGVRRKPGAGRKLKTPKTVKAALVHSTEQAKKFVKANGEIWFGEAFDIPTAVKELGADNLNEKLKQQIDEAAAAYDKLATTASEKGAVLRGVAAQVERRMKAQAEYEQRQAAEEEEGEIVCATAG